MQVGDKYTWTPAAWCGETAASPPGKKKAIPRSVTGKVIYIHPRRRYFTVQAKVNGGWITESFAIKHV